MAMTRSKMLAERRCGLKYWDKAVILTTRQEIINASINTSKAFPTIHSYTSRWHNFDWAIGNTVRKIATSGGDIAMSWNTDDVLTEDEISFISKELNIPLPYIPTWPRKP